MQRAHAETELAHQRLDANSSVENVPKGHSFELCSQARERRDALAKESRAPSLVSGGRWRDPAQQLLLCSLRGQWKRSADVRAQLAGRARQGAAADDRFTHRLAVALDAA